MNTLSLLNDAKYFDEGTTRLAEMRKMLDSRHMKDKLEAMKRLLAMMTIGRDVSSFFPDVVKNVIVDSQEVKKLVYMYLIAYSEQNQELALLSINTFQKDLASSSQRVRANAMKAMSSIKLPVAVPLVMLALRTAVKDQSSYVRKAAAAAIPKIYALDAEQHEMLVELIAELLTSTEPGVLGAAMFAFQEVCPNNWDLIHPHFRKICHLLADFDEWGQIVTINTLLRYGRTQFLSPFAASTDSTSAPTYKVEKEKAFYSDEEESASEEEEEKKDDEKEYVMDEDHKLLLKQASLLLYSVNAGVILAVAHLFYALAPLHELTKVARPMVRLARNKKSIAYIMLANIATMAAQRPNMFRPYLKDFFINATDPGYVRELKLDILANVATDTTISLVLKEFQAYTRDPDKEFVSRTIQAIGRCASAMPSIAERCMTNLMKLVTSPSESVVAQAVVVIRQLLQKNSNIHGGVIKQMAKLIDTVRVPMARTAIVWVIAEYHDKIPSLAPDALRKLAKTFKEEDETVKLQILNLSVKLFLSNPAQTSLLFKYVMDLARYDMNYDIRDRARGFRALFFKKKGVENSGDAYASLVKEQMKQSMTTSKPSPHIETPFASRTRFQLGSLSHIIDQEAIEYVKLPDFPDVAPDPSTRRPKATTYDDDKPTKKKKSGKFGSDSESESDASEDGSEASDFSSFSSGSDSDSNSSSPSDSDSDSSDSSSSSSSSSDSASDTDSDDGNDSDATPGKPGMKKDDHAQKKREEKLRERERLSLEKERERQAAHDAKLKAKQEKHDARKREREEKRRSSVEEEKSKKETKAAPTPAPAADFLDLSSLDSSSAILSPTVVHEDILTSTIKDEKVNDVDKPQALSISIPRTGSRGVLLNPISGGGLSIEYTFVRKASNYSSAMNVIDLHLINQSSDVFEIISVTDIKSDNDKDVHVFDEITNLAKGGQYDCKLDINFHNKTQPLQFNIHTGYAKYPVKLAPAIGDLIRPELISHAEFEKRQKKLQGMQEQVVNVKVTSFSSSPTRIVQHLWIQPLAQHRDHIYRFVGKCLADDGILLIQLVLTPEKEGSSSGRVACTVNCEDFMFGGHLIELLKKILV